MLRVRGIMWMLAVQPGWALLSTLHSTEVTHAAGMRACVLACSLQGACWAWS